ncbi:MAG: N-methyl-L-tryptophan oxidase [Gemmatimonadota bacterium]|nr:N-methyl-L-tryptophan oxidase [Gemmatimonadota bacterium]MDQ8147880.1 N-methyl-L-tryptophan oxidase [Gemmatimonadota bacterium]MDQ8149606.1 N-methyl-L-tryptophan oxidase [Gemmatimonadota bacterium]MDQ8157124.1 N-methyl-L-tryptophan oxidase [Gemmatimonadota bacterium]MDQ8177260.1 N-methyl-L-tryptophan oxidase [Gemmatimonadota bacterium]
MLTDSTADVVVLGLGAMGSLTVRELARRGAQVVGIDRGHPPHDLGSSHGRSRIIREAYFEDPLYVPLVQRAYDRWRTLETEGETLLLRLTGGLCLGAPTSRLVTGALASATQHGLPYERLDADTLRRRFPAHIVSDDCIGILEPNAGILDPEQCIATALRLATRDGATAHLGETVTAWTEHADHVEVRTTHRTVLAAQLIVSAGRGVRELMPTLAPRLTVERQVQFWFTPRAEATAFTPERFPVFLSEVRPGVMWYGFPDVGDGVKVAWHHGAPGTPALAIGDDNVHAPATAAEVAAMRAHLGTHLPWTDGTLRATATCHYTNTPDEHFIIDRAPDTDRVWVASPCSGHGFKFASAIGEVLADLVLGATPAFDLTPFGWR